MELIFLAVSLGAATIGAICGIGSGVIIKPALDALHMLDISTINFLSGCTVLAMTCYSVLVGKLSGDSKVDLRTATPLAVGAAIGGVAGQQLFQIVKESIPQESLVSTIQSVCLMLITLATLLYMINKNKIHTRQVRGALAGGVIGFSLGIISAFLGIGGGPINLMILFYFFSMDTKTAAQNSLYIILFSQLTSFLTTVLTGTVPEFAPLALGLMVLGGIGGGFLGRKINRRISGEQTDKLFSALMLVIIFINIYNIYCFQQV
ncbi:MAG: sulfite exporter TauE/SafE family protein [Eubacteriales bacterium]